jgi:hypothetical protein
MQIQPPATRLLKPVCFRSSQKMQTSGALRKAIGVLDQVVRGRLRRVPPLYRI